MLRIATKTLIFLAAAVIAFQAQAVVVFTDDFNAENGGNSALNFTGFANFNTIGSGPGGSGNVDLIKSGDFGITCPSGSCIDLDGSPGPARLESIASFAFNSGDFVRLSFDLSGNQRQSSQLDDYFVGFVFDSASTQLTDVGLNIGTGDQTLLDLAAPMNYDVAFPEILGSEGFAQRSIFFTAAQAGSLRFSIGTNSNDNIGAIIDNIALDISGAANPPKAVPEPSTIGLLSLGLIALLVRRRK